jgi:arylsulfatase A-like enzyme
MKNSGIIFKILVISLCANMGFAQQRPNIILIMTDDQSAIVPTSKDSEFQFADGNGRGTQSHPFGFNGDIGVLTPVIDGLAANGMIFTRAYVSSSVCSPSRYSTLTGRYPGRCEGNSFLKEFPPGTMTRVENNVELELTRENLPRLLQKAGYRTGFVGKSHVIDHYLLDKKNWEANGLMVYDQKDDPNSPEVSKAMAFNHQIWANHIKKYGFDYANAVYAANLLELKNDSLNVHNVEWKNRAALQFIDEAGDEPFFLYYSENIPHGPAPWIKKEGKYVYGLDANPKFTSKGLIEDKFENMPSRQQIKKEVSDAGLDPDHAWLNWFDHAVGAIVEKLREKGKLDNTLIVITSDHGNYNFGKTTLYEGGVKVPLMMYWPKGIKPGSHFDELVQNIDFAPTFLELAGVNLNSVEPIDGVSLKKTLAGDSKPVHDFLFFEIGLARGVTTKDWKYITVRYDNKTEKQVREGFIYKGWNGHEHRLPYYVVNSHLGYHAALLNQHYFEKDQLFYLKADPTEMVNLFDSKQDTVAKMKHVLSTFLKSFNNRPYAELTENMGTKF